MEDGKSRRTERRRMGIAHAPDERYEQFVDKWAMEIGRFILAFGSIEHTTYQALKFLPRDAIAAPLNKLLLSDRIEVLLAIADDRSDEESARLFDILNEVKALANNRNLVAHNGVGLDIYIDPENPTDVQLVETIRSGRDVRKHMELAQLHESRLRAEKLSRDLHEAVQAVREKVMMAVFK